MQSTLSPKPDDPCDDIVVVPDAVQVVPSDDELVGLLHQAARHRSPAHPASIADFTVDPAMRPIDAVVRPASADDARRADDNRAPAPVVEVGDRPIAANDDRRFRHRRSWARRAARALVVALLAVGIGVAAAAWKSYGATATKMLTKLTTQLVVGSSQPETSAPTTQPAPALAAVQTDQANATPAQPTPATQTAPAAAPAVPAAASPDQTQLLQSMARDLAALGQEVQDLKASVEQLKASQQQVSRDAARAAEPGPRPKATASTAASASTSLPRPAAMQTRKPTPAHAIAPVNPVVSRASPQVTAPYYPPPPQYPPQRYVPPQPAPPTQITAEPPIEADSSVLRPPMPVR